MASVNLCTAVGNDRDLFTQAEVTWAQRQNIPSFYGANASMLAFVVNSVEKVLLLPFHLISCILCVHNFKLFRFSCFL